jgi:hypothetical protein
MDNEFAMAGLSTTKTCLIVLFFGFSAFGQKNDEIMFRVIHIHLSFSSFAGC